MPDYLIGELRLSSEMEAAAHVELAHKFLEEGRNLVDKDPVQASEKLYKAAEEAVKALAMAHKLSEYKEAVKKGRWTATPIFNAVEELSKRMGQEVRDRWHAAWFLHVESFHEARLSVKLVKAEVGYVEKLVKLVERLI